MNRVIAVVPTYRPDTDVLTRLRAAARQVDRVIVVDDGSPDGSQELLEEIGRAGFRIIRRQENGGIAAALNVGIEAALGDGADYVLTIDQDSLLPAGYVQAALRVYESASVATNIGVVCADRINGAPSIPPRHSPEGIGLVNEAIQSGFVISSRCLHACGLFDEGLFIDCVDTEFCLRISDFGFRIAIALGTDLEHSLGERVALRPFGVQLKHNGQAAMYEYHRPYRRYFIIRNNIELWFRFWKPKRRWVLSAMKREYTPAVTAIVSGPQRLKQLIAAVAGTVDGLMRRSGPMPNRLRRLLS